MACFAIIILMAKKILLSGVKPTGRPHIGNYFGAMKQFVELLNSGEYECYFFIADYHALNIIQNAEEMRRHTLDLAIDYIAIGLDPSKATIFKQSDISAHTEAATIFDTLVTVPYLERAHAFKDAEAKGLEINVGTFNYPVLMAADILLYDADVVPVGQDQKQHLEYARDIAQKFNNTYGSVLKLPEPMIIENVAIVPGLDGRKMSKSYDNTIQLFASKEEITKSVMAIVTDSDGAFPTNVYNIHKLFKSEAQLKPLYEANKGKYKILKETLIDDIEAFIEPLRERREMVAADVKNIAKVLSAGAEKAHAKADVKLTEIKKAIGVL